MRTLDAALLRIAVMVGSFFAFLIAIESGLLSARFRGEGLLFRWQLWLLAGIFVVTLRDQLAALRCRACRQWNAPSLRALFRMGKMICRSCRELSEVRDGQGETLSMNQSREGMSL